MEHLSEERQLDLILVIKSIRAVFIPFSYFRVKVDRSEGVPRSSPKDIINDLKISMQFRLAMRKQDPNPVFPGSKNTIPFGLGMDRTFR